MQYKPSKPFSNGSEYQFFTGAFCERCILGGESPECRIESALAAAMFTGEWPDDGSICEVGRYGHVRMRFRAEDQDVQAMYDDLFKEA